MAQLDQDRPPPVEIPRSFEQLPMTMPPRLAELLGYPGHCRFVAFYWEQIGDELMFNDGLFAGTAECYPFKRLVEHFRVAPIVSRYDFGSSDSEAAHWLVIDRRASRAFGAPISAARAFLDADRLDSPALNEEQLHSVGQEIARLAQQLPDEARRQAIDAFARKQRHQVERLVRFLDRLPPER